MPLPCPPDTASETLVAQHAPVPGGHSPGDTACKLQVQAAQEVHSVQRRAQPGPASAAWHAAQLTQPGPASAAWHAALLTQPAPASAAWHAAVLTQPDPARGACSSAPRWPGKCPARSTVQQERLLYATGAVDLPVWGSDCHSNECSAPLSCRTFTPWCGAAHLLPL